MADGMAAIAETTEVFRAVFARCGVHQVTEEALRRMAAHWRLVERGNAQHNLTGIKEAHVAAEMHYVDAWQALPLLAGAVTGAGAADLVDFGSGGGFPGLALAALMPARRVDLVEPRRLRVAFLQQAVAELGWQQQVDVLARKVQGAPPRRYGHAVCRAVFARDADLAAAAPWLLPGGRLLSFRAQSAPLSAQVGPLRRVASHAYVVGPSARRIDVWQL